MWRIKVNDIMFLPWIDKQFAVHIFDFVIENVSWRQANEQKLLGGLVVMRAKQGLND